MFRHSQTKHWHCRPNRTEDKIKQNGQKRHPQPNRNAETRQRKNPYTSFVQHQIETKPWSKQRQIATATDKIRRHATAETCNGSSKTHAAATVDETRMMKHGIATVINAAPRTRQVRRTLWRKTRYTGYAQHEFAKDTTPAAHETQKQRPMTHRGSKTDSMIGYTQPLKDELCNDFHKGNALTQNRTSQTTVSGRLPSSDDSYVPLMAIETAVDQTPHPSIVACRETEGRNDEPSCKMYRLGNPVHEGLGVARFGNDKTVASIRRGHHLTDLKLSPKSDIMTIVATSMHMMRRNNVNAITSVDDAGIGASVTTRTHRLATPNPATPNGGKTPNQQHNIKKENNRISSPIKGDEEYDWFVLLYVPRHAPHLWIGDQVRNDGVVVAGRPHPVDTASSPE